jgi:hypothetical protein
VPARALRIEAIHHTLDDRVLELILEREVDVAARRALERADLALDPKPRACVFSGATQTSIQFGDADNLFRPAHGAAYSSATASRLGNCARAPLGREIARAVSAALGRHVRTPARQVLRFGEAFASTAAECTPVHEQRSTAKTKPKRRTWRASLILEIRLTDGPPGRAEPALCRGPGRRSPGEHARSSFRRQRPGAPLACDSIVHYSIFRDGKTKEKES